MDPDPYSHIFSDMFSGSWSATDFMLAALTLVLTIVNARVSGSEVAFFSLNQEELSGLHAETSRDAARIRKLLKDPERLSSTIFIAYIFLNISISALLLYLLFSNTTFFNNGAGSIVGLTLVSIYVLLFLEIFPKIYASQKPLRFVKRNHSIIHVIDLILSPFSRLLVMTTDIFGKYSINKKYDISLEDLSTALEMTSDETNSLEKEKDMLEGIIRFRDKTVEDIMVARSDMVAIEIDTPFSEVIKFIVSAGFSRIPAFEENPDSIKGILYVKDLLPHLDKADNFRWQSLIRPAYFVPRTKRIDDLLEEFRADKNHMAIIVDEYGGTSGIVTMEDILEEIVGDISDEYDEEASPQFVKMQDGSYVFEGKTALDDFIEIVSVPKKDFEKIGEEVDSLAGLMLELKGDFPKPKESIEYRGYGFKAEEMDDRRIVKVKFTPRKNTAPSDIK